MTDSKVLAASYFLCEDSVEQSHIDRLSEDNYNKSPYAPFESHNNRELLEEIEDVASIIDRATQPLEKELLRAQYKLRIANKNADWLNELASCYRGYGATSEYCDELCEEMLQTKADLRKRFEDKYNEQL